MDSASGRCPLETEAWRRDGQRVRTRRRGRWRLRSEVVAGNEFERDEPRDCRLSARGTEHGDWGEQPLGAVRAAYISQPFTTLPWNGGSETGLGGASQGRLRGGPASLKRRSAVPKAGHVEDGRRGADVPVTCRAGVANWGRLSMPAPVAVGEVGCRQGIPRAKAGSRVTLVQSDKPRCWRGSGEARRGRSGEPRLGGRTRPPFRPHFHFPSDGVSGSTSRRSPSLDALVAGAPFISHGSGPRPSSGAVPDAHVAPCSAADVIGSLKPSPPAAECQLPSGRGGFPY